MNITEVGQAPLTEIQEEENFGSSSHHQSLYNIQDDLYNAYELQNNFGERDSYVEDPKEFMEYDATYDRAIQ